jgi:stress-induced-phosphoprotein 1
MGLQCIKVNPSWAKGYARKGAALHGQRRYVEAIEAYETGLKIEDVPAIRKGYEEVKAAKGALELPRCPSLNVTHRARHNVAADERGDGAEATGLGKMFSDPNMLSKLAANPRTAKHLADASFMQKVSHPRSLLSHLALTSFLFVRSSNSYNRIRSSHKACSAAIHA